MIFWADAILIVHVLFTSIVIWSVPLIIIGGFRHWRWVRNRWFRFTHLAMIVFVAFEAIIGMDCPLTVWESNLRDTMGQQGYNGQDFIANWLGRLIFYSFPHWVFTVSYIGFGLLVLSLLYFVPIQSSKAPNKAV